MLTRNLAARLAAPYNPTFRAVRRNLDIIRRHAKPDATGARDYDRFNVIHPYNDLMFDGHMAILSLSLSLAFSALLALAFFLS